MRYSRKLLKKEYKGLFDYSLNLVYVLDENGKFLDSNKICLETLGLEKNEINRVKFDDLRINKNHDGICKIFDDFTNKIYPKERYYHQLKINENNTISLEATYFPILFDEKLSAILGIAKILDEKLNQKGNFSYKESLTRNFLENTQEGLIFLNKDGRIEFVNHKICEILDYDKDELIGKKVRNLVKGSSDKLGNFDNITEKITNQKNYFNFWKRMGHIAYTKVNFKPVFDKNNEYKGVVMNLIDITDEVEVKDKLERSLKTTNKILENLPIGIILIGYDRRIKRVNKRALEICGYQSEYDLLGKICNKQFCEVEVAECPIMTLKNVAIKSEAHIFSKNGKKIPILKKVIPITLSKEDILVEAFMDISEQKETESKLRKSERKYRNLLERAPYPIILTDEDGIIKDINKQTCKLLIISKDNLIGKQIFNVDIFPSEKQKNLIREDLNVSISNHNSKALEVLLKDSEKKIHWIKLKSTVFNFGNQIYIQTILNDISDIKRSEILMNRFNKELEKQVEERTLDLKKALEEKELLLEEVSKASHFKSQFMASMSHELRTPLNSIIGFSDLLLNKIYGDLIKTQEEPLEDIKSSAEHLLDLINSIMDISSIEAGEQTLEINEFSVKKVINQIVAEFIPMIRKKDLELELIGLEDENLIKADIIRFKSILSNLISNAVKFTMDGKIQIIFEQDKQDWIFKVRDTGIGISETDYDKIFQEFKQIENPYISNTEGIGLGLPLTRRLVGLHGGKLWFESEIGEGSAFFFTIPKSRKSRNNNKIEQFFKLL
ncbi:MAG: PAS domain S-box protein [Candidatus Lokiarchaeota archaeon]|nr:PAS domain S-box protein [Candidatus Lokiarchaeota archaeon]MBD3200462.1 PAS domain S-box protein [Candidatus Lokiarchaeota archaeon]